MFYLSNFCRICVQTGNQLVDINTRDTDLVTLREKLQACTKIVVGEQDLSKLICLSCVKKLRVSYKFQEMCTKSEDVLRGYLSELIAAGKSNEECFVKSELKVTLTPIPTDTLKDKFSKLQQYSVPETERNPNGLNPPVPSQKVQKVKEDRVTQNHRLKIREDLTIKKKRVSKGQRCSLLKKLLSTINSNSLEQKPTQVLREATPNKKTEGGLKNLLGFIQEYNFGYKIKSEAEQLSESTPLDKLENFSKTFFYTDFSAYQDTILKIITDSKNDSGSDDDEMFNSYDESEDKRLWFGIKQESEEFEHVIIEPDIKIKTEFISENDCDEEFLPSELVQACYDPNPKPGRSTEYVDFESYLNKRSLHHNNNVFSNTPSSTVPSSLELLQQFTSRTKGGSSTGAKKTMSPNSLKCRTRGQPFINPQLMEQFQKRSFRCDTCNRSFKSPGYLHSHCTKMGH